MKLQGLQGLLSGVSICSLILKALARWDARMCPLGFLEGLAGSSSSVKTLFRQTDSFVASANSKDALQRTDHSIALLVSCQSMRPRYCCIRILICSFQTGLECVSVPQTASNTLSFSLSGVGPRTPSAGEVLYLRRLVNKYGDDVERMSRDRRLNPEQRTIGQLRNALRRVDFNGSVQMYTCKQFEMFHRESSTTNQ